VKSSDHFDSSINDPSAREIHVSNGRHGPRDVFSKFQADVSAAGGRLLEIYMDRARLSTRRALAALIGGVGVAVFCAVALGSAAAAMTSGTCAAFTELFDGRAWLGNLVGGLAVVLLFASAAALASRASERQALKSLRAKYGASPHDDPHAADTSTESAPRDLGR
jgi:hypothetical protein